MTELESKVLIRLSLNPGTGGSLLAELANHLPTAVFLSRIPKEVEVTEDAKCFIASMLTTPGESVLWAFTLAVDYWQHGEVIDLKRMCSAIFPMGVPSEDGISEAWTAQKGYTYKLEGIDNLLDQPQFISEVKASIQTPVSAEASGR